MGRTAKVTAIVFGVFVFLGISALLARALSGTGSERAKVVDLLQAQARGDADAVLGALPACAQEPACARVTRERVAEIRRPGEVEILKYDPSVRVPLTRQAGTARVAWRTDIEQMPVVQCLKVRREGPVTGGRTELLAISPPIAATAACE